VLDANGFANASPQILLNHLEDGSRLAFDTNALDDVEQRAQRCPSLRL